jgi:hypothetical protein
VVADGTRYLTGREGRSQVYNFFRDTYITLPADQIFGRQQIPRTVTEKTIADLRADWQAKLNRREGALSPHPEIIYIPPRASSLP